MKICYVTRSHEDAGVQGKLNGGYSIAAYLNKEFGIEHVQIPNTSYPGEGTFPEIKDLYAYNEMSKVDWGKYDYVLYGEYAYAPFFYLVNIPASMLVHSLWIWEDGTAHVLKKFLPFIQSAICPTLEVKGLFEAMGIPNVWLPYPVPDDYFIPYPDNDFNNRSTDVIWVGRNGIHKDPQALYTIANLMPHRSFKVFSSTPLYYGIAGNIDCPTDVDNLRFEIRQPREKCHSSMADSKVLLMTSNFETYATCLIEAGLSGCAVIAKNVWGVAHTVPGTTLYNDVDEAVKLIDKHCKSGPQMPRNFWVRSFGSSGVSDAWFRFLDSKSK